MGDASVRGRRSGTPRAAENATDGTAPGRGADLVDVTVAVLTFRRNEELATLLPLLVREIDALAATREPGFTTEVVVVDNDPARGAGHLVGAFRADRVRYAAEPTAGIAAARNRALSEAGRSRVLVFIDDDERPVEGWLTRIVGTHDELGPAAVAGPVRSRFEGDLDPWIEAGGFFRRVHNEHLRTGDRVPAAATNNLLLDMTVVRRHGLRFDESLGLSGGEDTLFTRALVAAGGTIVWCREAEVIDVVPAARMTRRFVLSRVYSHSNVSVGALLRLAGSPARRGAVRARYLVIGSGRTVLGAARAVAGTVVRRADLQASGMRLVARGVGSIVAVAGRRTEEYRRDQG
ncbi:glycosyltransferase family 2 protein [Cellulomonas fengjieae]|uniref:glycosyltransferase family 2 protein n=1 Tax=Cellulomonas fengjieae TaxID=2819978 RepID=UPI001AAF6B77|nr:glycosyltransferase [Cellulomonas fengjieae]MBO3100542.1 glycosyltransferase [Cellulomonas fengjieae]